MDLQNIFYITAIVSMILMIIASVVVVGVLLSIKAKIDAVHRSVVKKTDLAKSLVSKAGIALNTVRYFVTR